MKYKYLIFFLWGTLLFTSSGYAVEDISIELLDKTLSNTNLKKQIDYKNQPIGAFDTGKDLFWVQTHPTGDREHSSVYCYDYDGNLNWEKQGYFLGITASQNSNKVVLIHDWETGDKAIYSCFDESGACIWSKKLYCMDFMINADGKYAITVNQSDDEDAGWFQVFDMQTGNEILSPIDPHSYSFFHALFLHNDQVVLLLQRYESVVDKEKLAIIEQKIKELEENRQSLTQRAFSKEYLELDSESAHTRTTVFSPARLVIYDIPTNSIIAERDLVASNGNALWSESLWQENIQINPTGDLIAMKLHFEPLKVAHNPEMLYVVDRNLNELLVENDVGRLKSFKFVNNDLLLVNHGRYSKNFSLYDVKRKQKKWMTISDKKGPWGVIRDIHLNDSLLYFNDYNQMNWISNWQVNLDTGEITMCHKNSNLLLNKIVNSSIILNTNSNSISIYNK